MAVDKNLFKYDLAVVAILCNEGHYLKEWLDYHLLAGVDHFYLYNHESTDNYDEIVQPYVEKGLVTSVYFPGKFAMYPAYNDAIQKYSLSCRYMAFIDLDEFIFPKSKSTVSEVLDDIFPNKPYVAGLSVNWRIFGSNGQEKADYSRDVMERFTRCQSGASEWTKVIVNPRKVHFFDNPHSAFFFDRHFSVDENYNIVNGGVNKGGTIRSIAINHYKFKSLEEYVSRNARVSVAGSEIEFGKHSKTRLGLLDSENKPLGGTDNAIEKYSEDYFRLIGFNDTFDDGILQYQDSRRKELGGGGDIKIS